MAIGIVLCALVALPWFWNARASRSVGSGAGSGRYMLGLSSILRSVGLSQLAGSAWYEGQRIREGAVFLDYPVLSKHHADALLDGARTVSTSLGKDGGWGTNQTKDLDTRKILRFRIPRDHNLKYAKAIEAADNAFRSKN